MIFYFVGCISFSVLDFNGYRVLRDYILDGTMSFRD